METKRDDNQQPDEYRAICLQKNFAQKCLHSYRGALRFLLAIIGALSVPFKLSQMPKTGIEFQKWNVLELVT